jgi:AraC-like DNA-binding protein
MDASRTWVYRFDNLVVNLVDGIDAGSHKHGAYQLSISLDETLEPAMSSGWAGSHIRRICGDLIGTLADEPFEQSSGLHPSIAAAMRLVIGGASITDAAAAAGFADASRLSRSTQQYFGLRPMDLTAHPDIIAEVCLTEGSS